MNDKQLAEYFNTTEQSVNAWKIQFPEFLECIKKGRTETLTKVIESLYNQAIGGNVIAGIFIAKCRLKAYGWHEKQEVEVHGKHEVSITFKPSNDEPLKEYKPEPRKEPDSLSHQQNDAITLPEEAEIIPEDTPEEAPVLWKKIEVDWLQ